ncbi:unnamed protein product [Oikopleura dioica]|uniref:Uncharacterized protein n=1 Tax=Oikopleura dioica TaxID=34765 RepID=E4Z740_OIKDI|nr:unnamed protein product [Oikopleura dioica]
MKISPLLVTAVVGKPSEEGIAPRFSASRTIEQCGGSFIATISTAFGFFNMILQFLETN